MRGINTETETSQGKKNLEFSKVTYKEGSLENGGKL